MVRQRYLPVLPARSAHMHSARQAWMGSCNARPRPLTPLRFANGRAFLTQAHTIVKYDVFRAAKPMFLSFWVDVSTPQFHYSFPTGLTSFQVFVGLALTVGRRLE
jgi:hypothetical protein